MTRLLFLALLAVCPSAIAQEPPPPPPPRPVEKPQEPPKPAQDPKEKPKAAESEPEAEALYKRFEEKVTKSKTVKFKATIAMEMKEMAAEFTSEGCLKEGNKFKFNISGELMGQAREVSVVCDGAKILTDSGRGEPKTEDARKDMAEAMRVLMARAGAIMPMMLGETAGRDPEKDLKEFMKVSGFKAGKDEKVGERNCKVLTYKAVPDNEKEAEVKLWLDAETLKPVKREIKAERGEVFSETYASWIYDEEIKDDVFNLPKEK
jgi:outer membrane lipoprotein-sorting protein